MAKQTIVKLTDDIDGTSADETVVFSVDGKAYEIDLSKKNAQALRNALQPYVDAARVVGRPSTRSSRSSRSSRSASTGRAPQSSRRGASTTLFSQLDAEEKDRFRVWANMPTARRISDARVQAWIDAGRP
jgi:hypothetical protein